MTLLRLWAVGLLTCTALITPTRQVHGECGGGDSDSGGGGGGGGSGGGGEGGSSSEPSCVSTNDIVGYNECGRFGGWDRSIFSSLRLGLGYTSRSIPTGQREFSGSVKHEDLAARSYSFDGNSMSENNSDVHGIETSAEGFVSDHFLVGVQGGVGIGGTDGRSEFLGHSLEAESVAHLYGAAKLGLQVPMGAWLVRSEALLGAQTVGLTFESRLGECVTGTSSWRGSPLGELRVGAERWLGPWMTAGLTVGRDLLGDGGTSIGVGFSLHGNPYDSRGVIAPW